MDKGIRQVVADECHRLQAELRLTSQKNLIPELQDELRSIRFSIWANETPERKQIIETFQKIIEHPRSTDVITFVAVNALSEFLRVGLFTGANEIGLLVQCLCSCQYQITSESDCVALTVEILSIFIRLMEAPYVDHLSTSTIETLFMYCEQDMRQLSRGGVHAGYLTKAVCRLVRLMVDREEFFELSHEAFMTLFYIADASSTNCGWIPRSVALRALVEIAESENATKVRDLIHFSCILLHQQLQLLDGRDNFVLALRLFFGVFKDQWINQPIPFAKCLNSILDFCNLQDVSQPLKSTAFEILIDFVLQNNFIVNFYANFGERKFFPRIFEKFVEIVITFANIPAVVPDAQASAFRLLSSMIAQMTPDVLDNRMMMPYDTEENSFKEEENIAEIQEFVEKFNQKPSSVIAEKSTAAELAKILFTAEGISKQAIGDFFGHTKPICLETMREYIKLFDFGPLNIDQAIRVFLTSFRIPGEAQIVDRLLDNFSMVYYDAHPNSHFASAAAVHIMSVGFLMLHTSIYNEQVKQKETLTGFLTLLKGKNDGQDWDPQFLTSIYNSVKRTEISAVDQPNFQSLAFWELVIQKQRVMNLSMKKVNLSEKPGILIKLFRDIWQHAAPIFTAEFEHSNNSCSIVLETFTKCANMAASFQLHDVLDNLIVSFCKFTNSKTKSSLSVEASKEALLALSSIVFQHGPQIHEGWKWFVELLVALFRLDVLPEEMRTQTSFDVSVVIGPDLSHKKQHKNSSVFSLFRMLGAYESESESDGGATEIHNVEQRNFIKDCKLNQIFDQSLHFTSQSLSYFMKSLILTTQSIKSELEDRTPEASICLHWITQTAIVNSERIQPLWSSISDLFTDVLSTRPYSKASLFFTQRALAAVFNLLNHLWAEKNLRYELIGLLDKVTTLSKDQKMFTSLLPDILNGIKIFFSMHLTSFVKCYRYKAVLTILSAGINLPDSESVSLVHQLAAKFNAMADQPGLERLTDLWLPLIQVIVMYCIRNSNDDYFIRFRDLQTLLVFSSFKSQTPEMWSSVFETTLFPAMEKLPSEISSQKKTTPNILDRALLMTKTTFKAFLAGCHHLSQLPTFECIWFKLVQFSFNLMHIGDADFNETIPELLSNAMLVMRGGGIFDGEERQRMWLESRAVIEPLSPSFAP